MISLNIYIHVYSVNMQVYVLFCFLQVYEEIASHFSGTRHSPWPRISEFLLKQPPGSLMADIGCGNGKYLGINKSLYQVVYTLNYSPNNQHLHKSLYEIVCVLHKLFSSSTLTHFYQVGFYVIIHISLSLHYHCLHKYLQQLVNIFDIPVCGLAIDVLSYIYLSADFVNYIPVLTDRVRQKLQTDRDLQGARISGICSRRSLCSFTIGIF